MEHTANELSGTIIKTTDQDNTYVEMNNLNSNDDQGMEISTNYEYKRQNELTTLEVSQKQKNCDYDNELKEALNKNPICVLNEYVSKKLYSKAVSYNLSIDLQNKKKIYTFTCKIKSKTTKGMAFTKKEAKKIAATKMIKKYFGANDSKTDSDQVVTSPISTVTQMCIDTNLSQSDHHEQKIETIRNTSIDENDKQNLTTIKKLHKESPLILMRKWSTFNKSNIKLSYAYVNSTFQHSVLVYTYMCYVDNMSVQGEGLTKKKAKRNAAANMWTKLLNVDPRIHSFIDQINSNKLKVKSSCGNYISIVQELCTSYKWKIPIYKYQKLIYRDNAKSITRNKYNTTCQVFHLQTADTNFLKKESKHTAARLMYNKIFDFGIDKLNKLNSLQLIIKLPNEESESNKMHMTYKQIKELSSEFNLAEIFQSFIRAVNNMKKSENLIDLQIEELGKKNHRHDIKPLSIYNPNSSPIDQLRSLCSEFDLNVSNSTHDKNIDGNFTLQTIVLTVHILPKIVAFGSAMTKEIAEEIASANAIRTLKALASLASKLPCSK